MSMKAFYTFQLVISCLSLCLSRSRSESSLNNKVSASCLSKTSNSYIDQLCSQKNVAFVVRGIGDSFGLKKTSRESPSTCPYARSQQINQKSSNSLRALTQERNSFRGRPTTLFANLQCIAQGSTVVIVGANNRIGRLVADQLATSGLRLRLVGDNAEWATDKSRTGSADIFLGNIAQDPAKYDMDELFLGYVTSAGTSAIPLREVLRGAQGVVLCPESSSFPSPTWLMGGTPYQQDVVAARNIAASLDVSSTRTLVFLSSIGAQRPLPRIPQLDENLLLAVTNAFGAIDAKRAAEDVVRAAARRAGCDAYIVRAKLHCYPAGPFGGPGEVLPPPHTPPTSTHPPPTHPRPHTFDFLIPRTGPRAGALFGPLRPCRRGGLSGIRLVAACCGLLRLVAACCGSLLLAACCCRLLLPLAACCLPLAACCLPLAACRLLLAVCCLLLLAAPCCCLLLLEDCCLLPLAVACCCLRTAACCR
jgi:hypothetical protein